MQTFKLHEKLSLDDEVWMKVNWASITNQVVSKINRVLDLKLSAHFSRVFDFVLVKRIALKVIQQSE